VRHRSVRLETLDARHGCLVRRTEPDPGFPTGTVTAGVPDLKDTARRADRDQPATGSRDSAAARAPAAGVRDAQKYVIGVCVGQVDPLPRPPVATPPRQRIARGELRTRRRDAADRHVPTVSHRRALNLRGSSGVRLQRRVVVDQREARPVIGLPARRPGATLYIDARTGNDVASRATGAGSDEALAQAAVLLERCRDLTQRPAAGAQPRAGTRIAVGPADLSAD